MEITLNVKADRHGDRAVRVKYAIGGGEERHTDPPRDGPRHRVVHRHAKLLGNGSEKTMRMEKSSQLMGKGVRGTSSVCSFRATLKQIHEDLIMAHSLGSALVSGEVTDCLVEQPAEVLLWRRGRVHVLASSSMS